MVGVISFSLLMLEPALPSVSRDRILIGEVKRGELVREVVGPGMLVPISNRWVAAQTDGRVEKVLVQPGTYLEADTVIIELSNPQLEQSAEEIQFELKVAEKEYTALQAKFLNEELTQEAEVAAAETRYKEAQLLVEARSKLMKTQVVSVIDYKEALLKEKQYKAQLEIEKKRQKNLPLLTNAQLEAQMARVDQLKKLVDLRRRLKNSLRVRAGIEGVLQKMKVEPGQQVEQGAVLALVAKSDQLKAELQIAETQAKDVALQLGAQVDTRNGLIHGRVIRIDPAVENGTVTVDILLEGDLPVGARPDLRVEGRIKIERLADTLYIDRPVNGREHAQVQLFVLDEASAMAKRKKVKLGKSSVNQIEVVSGLGIGERVILSDMTSMAKYKQLNIN